MRNKDMSEREEIADSLGQVELLERGFDISHSPRGHVGCLQGADEWRS